MKQYLQKFKIANVQFSVQFFLACLVLTIAFFLVFISSLKTYTASITIMVNAKSEVVAKQEKKIIGNIIELPQLLSFYERLLKDNSDVRDIAEDKDSAQRKKAWNDMLSVKKVGRDSSLIKISITTIQKNDAKQLVQKTTRTLFNTIGVYYNIKNDIDLRIVEGPILERNIVGWWWMLTLSLALSFLTVIFLQKMIVKSINAFLVKEASLKNNKFFDYNTSAIEKTSMSREAEIEALRELYMSDQIETSFQIQQNFATSQFQEKKSLENTDEEIETPKDSYLNDQIETAFPIEQKKDPLQFQEMKKLTKMTEQDKYPNYREVPKKTQKKASAPDNLPIADDSFFMHKDSAIKEKSQQERVVSLEPEIKNYEPTAEELKTRLDRLLHPEIKQKELAAEDLKKRLNKLLKGEI